MFGIGSAKVVASIKIGGCILGAIFFGFFDRQPAVTVFYLACALMGALLLGHPELMPAERPEDMEFSSFAVSDYLLLASALVLGILALVAMLLT